MPSLRSLKAVGDYVIGDGAVACVPKLVARFAGAEASDGAVLAKVLVVVDRHADAGLLAALTAGAAQTLVLEDSRCTEANARSLCGRIEGASVAVVVAAGGGKVLDLVRAALCLVLRGSRPRLVLVPTIVTTNACATSLAIVYDEAGAMVDVWDMGSPADCVVVDSGLIARARARFLAAAIGDQVASSLEALHAMAATPDPLGAAHHRAVLDVLLAHGEGAYRAVQRHEVTPALELVLQTVTYYTPQQVATAAAYFSHLLDEYLLDFPQVRARMHGEVVGYGVLPELVVAGERDELPRWERLFEAVGIPCSLAGLGLAGVTRESLVATFAAHEKGLLTRASAFQWTPEQLAYAMLAIER